jgi:hypothetical protein
MTSRITHQQPSSIGRQEPPGGITPPAGIGRARHRASLTNSASVIRELSRRGNKDEVSDSRIRRGERFATLVHFELSRRSPELGDELRHRLADKRQLHPVDLRGERLIKSTTAALRDMVHEGLISKRFATTISTRALKGTQPPEAKPDPRQDDVGNCADRTAATSHAPSSLSPGAWPKGPTLALDAPLGFLWKPFSDSDGLLAILLPESWTDFAVGVEVCSPDGEKVYERGRSAGIGNGGRAHFRFTRTGEGFPPGSVTRVTFADGSFRDIPIAITGVRGEGRG